MQAEEYGKADTIHTPQEHEIRITTIHVGSS